MGWLRGWVGGCVGGCAGRWVVQENIPPCSAPRENASNFLRAAIADECARNQSLRARWKSMSNAANYRTFWYGAQRQTRYKQKHRRAVPMGMGFDICTLQVSSLARVVYKTDHRLMIEHHRNHLEIASALRGCQRRHTPPLTLHCTSQRNRRTWRCTWRYMLPMLYDRTVSPD